MNKILYVREGEPVPKKRFVPGVGIAPHAEFEPPVTANRGVPGARPKGIYPPLFDGRPTPPGFDPSLPSGGGIGFQAAGMWEARDSMGPRVHRFIRAGDLFGPLFPVPAEIVACCDLVYTIPHGLELYQRHRFWTGAAARIASKAGNASGVRPPKGLHLPLERGKIPLARFLELKRSVGGFPPSFTRRVLRGYGLDMRLAGPLVAEDKFLTQQCWKEGFLEFLADRNPLTAPLRATLNDRFNNARYMETTWDVVRHACALTETLPSVEWRERFARAILSDSEDTASAVKQFAQEARAMAFGGHERSSWLWVGFPLPGGERDLLQWSFMARSLPSPMSTAAKQLRKDYEERMTRELHWPTGRQERFDLWIQTWAMRHRPNKIVLQSGFSTKGGLEFPRDQGGLPRALDSYASYNVACEVIGYERFTLLDGNLATASPFWWLPAERWRNVVGGCVRTMRQWSGPVPVQLIFAPEKGLKTRGPTKTVLPVIVLGGYLRGIIDQFLIRDPRIGPSITQGDPLRHGPEFNPDHGPWRSVDCVTATDNFTVEYMRSIYAAVLTECVGLIAPPWLELLWEVWAWLFKQPRQLLGDHPDGWGPPELLPSSLAASRLMVGAGADPDELPVKSLCPHIIGPPARAATHPLNCDCRDFRDSLELSWARGQQNRVRELGTLQYSERFPTDTEARTFALQWETWVTTLCHWHDVTPLSRGAMMGDPTSWPGLPLATLFAWESVTPPSWHMKISTTGDDAYFQSTNVYHDAFKREMADGGAEFSEKKYYSHDELALYCEEVLRHGKLEPYQSLAPLVGPPGGSKGESNWATAPDSCRALSQQRGCGEMPYRSFRISRFFPEWQAAQRLGIPIQLPPRWGGFNFPWGKWTSKKNHELWGNYVASLSRARLVLQGPGLHLVAAPKVANLSALQIFTLAGRLAIRREMDMDDAGAFWGGPKVLPGGIAAIDARVPAPGFQMGPATSHHWTMYRRYLSEVDQIDQSDKEAAIRSSNADVERWLLTAISAAEKAGLTTGVSLRDLAQHLSYPAQVDRLLSGFRPASQKVPSVFKLAGKFWNTIRKSQQRGVPRSDEALIQMKEDLLLPRVNVAGGPLAFQAISLPAIRFENQMHVVPSVD